MICINFVWCGTCCICTNRAQDRQIRRLAWPSHVVRLGQTAGSSMWTCGQTSLNGRCVVWYPVSSGVWPCFCKGKLLTTKGSLVRESPWFQARQKFPQTFMKLHASCVTHWLHFPSVICKAWKGAQVASALGRALLTEGGGREFSRGKKHVTRGNTWGVLRRRCGFSQDVSRPKTCPTDADPKHFN